MADPISVGIAAAMSGASALFSYNKDAFVFEQTLRQAEAHQSQAMRVQEVALYREDIRDLFGVTVQKMDNYLIVNTLMLGFCISLLYAVDLPLSTPDWIYWMWTLSMSGAILFILLSIWLCLHASITAQSLVVRLLTQWLRLPVPNAKEISKFAAKFQDYEKSANKLLRMPGFTGAVKGAGRSNSSPSIPEHFAMPTIVPGKDGEGLPPGDVMQGIEDLSGLQLQKTHLHLFRQLARSWRGYDAYARVCMIMGTNQLLQALGHLSIAKTFLVNQQLVASLFVVITMHSLSLIHFKLNINPTREQHNMMTILLGVPPVTAFIAASLWFYGEELAADIVAIVAILIHLVWICFVLTLAMEDDGGMPKNFTQVGLSSDIVGDDTFVDYIEDELERIKTGATAVSTAEGGGLLIETVPGHSARVTHAGEDPLVLVRHRLHKLMRQWANVAAGTLAFTPAEEIKRKRKIAHRFDKLSKFVKALPIHEREVVGDELRILMDAKWNRMNSGVFINIDTGEIRTPQSPASNANPLATVTPISNAKTSPVEQFVDQVKHFREVDGDHQPEYEGHSDDGSSSDGEVSDGGTAGTYPRKSPTESALSTAKDVVITVKPDMGESETSSLVFGDSHKTNKMLRKASTRPWSAYKQGSALLIICWMIALIMSVLLPFGISLHTPPRLAAMRMAANNGGNHRAGSGTGGGADAGVGSAQMGIRLAGFHR